MGWSAVATYSRKAVLLSGVAAGGQVRYSATYQMLLEASFREPDSVRGVCDVGAASPPDSATSSSMCARRCVQERWQPAAVAVSAAGTRVLRVSCRCCPHCHNCFVFALQHKFSYQKSYLGLQFRGDQEQKHFYTEQHQSCTF